MDLLPNCVHEKRWRKKKMPLRGENFPPAPFVPYVSSIWNIVFNRFSWNSNLCSSVSKAKLIYQENNNSDDLLAVSVLCSGSVMLEMYIHICEGIYAAKKKEEKLTPPLSRIVAVSGTLNTLQPSDSKNVARRF